MFFDYSKLLGKIKEVCGTQSAFSKKIGVSHTSISQKLNNKSDFTAKEILRACNLLSIPEAEIPIYFFCSQSSETRTNQAVN